VEGVTLLSFFAKLFSKKAFFALHYGQSRALLALLAQSHT